MIPVVIDSLIRTAELALLAIGLTMVYSMLRFPNFSHVELAPIGAYIALAANKILGLPLFVAGASAALVAGLLGVLADRVVFAPLRGRSPVILMIAAFSLGIVMRETIRAIWGPSPYIYIVGLEEPRKVFGENITSIQIWIIITALFCMLFFHLLLNYTRLGLSMRAAADNEQLAEASGIFTERVTLWVWFIGSVFAGVGGILLGLDTQLRPMMGFGIIVSVFSAALVGGIGNPYGAMLGATIIGFAENIGLAINWAFLFEIFGETDGYVFIPTGYKSAIPFTFLIVVLLVRPQGLLGSMNR